MVFSKVINVKCVPVYNRRVLRIQPYAFQKTFDCIRVENSFVTDMSDMHEFRSKMRANGGLKATPPPVVAAADRLHA